MGLPTPTTHACFCILTSSDEGIELLHINIHINPIDSDGPRLHTSTPHRASTPRRLHGSYVTKGDGGGENKSKASVSHLASQ